MKKLLPICLVVCCLVLVGVVQETGATRVILGDIVAVSEHGQKRYIHLQDQGFELSPDAPAFDSVMELAVPFEARIVIEADESGQDHAIDIQPRYQ
jgi:hypothetical protein